MKQLRKKHIATIILSRLLLLVVGIFLITSIGAYGYLSMSSKEYVVNSITSFTHSDTEGFMRALSQKREKDMRTASASISVFCDTPFFMRAPEELNNFLMKWSSTRFMSELDLVNPSGDVVYSSNRALIGINLWQADRDLTVTAASRGELIGKTLPELGIPVEKGNAYSQLFMTFIAGEKVYAFGDNSLGFFIFYIFPHQEIMRSPPGDAGIHPDRHGPCVPVNLSGRLLPDPTEGRECLVIADVSGKGISAALFMMRSGALIRHRAPQGGHTR